MYMYMYMYLYMCMYMHRCRYRYMYVYVYSYKYCNIHNIYMYIYIFIYIYGTPPPKIHAFLSVLSSSCAIPACLFFMSSVCLSSRVNTPTFSKHTHIHTQTRTQGP